MNTKRMMLCVAAVLVVLLLLNVSHGEIILDTASGAPHSAGLYLEDDYWAFHRFELTNPTNIESVGGYFYRRFEVYPDSVFSAVIELSGPSDDPDSMYLTTPDVLATGLVPLDVDRGAYFGNLSLSLPPGWYGLAFGTGAFGAPSGGKVFMPYLSEDLDPAQSMIGISHYYSSYTIYSQPFRFFVSTDPVPEPSTLFLLAAGALGLLAYRGRRKA